MKKKITVKIQRKNYTFLSDETKEYTDNLANLLDRKINEKLSCDKGLSTLDAACLTAFECLDDLLKANNNIDNIRSQIKDYVDESAAAKEENQKLKAKFADAEKLAEERDGYKAQFEDAQRKVSLLREKYAELYNEYKHLKSALKGANVKADTAPQTKTKSPDKQTNQQGFVGMNGYKPKDGGKH